MQGSPHSPPTTCGASASSTSSTCSEPITSPVTIQGHTVSGTPLTSTSLTSSVILSHTGHPRGASLVQIQSSTIEGLSFGSTPIYTSPPTTTIPPLIRDLPRLELAPPRQQLYYLDPNGQLQVAPIPTHGFILRYQAAPGPYMPPPFPTAVRPPRW